MSSNATHNDKVISLIGLGYVGLPLALALGEKYTLIAFDSDENKIKKLAAHQDDNHQFEAADFENKNITFTADSNLLKKAQVHIIAVPTPIDEARQPDLKALIEASETIGKQLKKGDLVVYESTVYPGCTENVCLPILEQKSGLKCNQDFGLGYSPERINPGDEKHSLQNVVKVVSGSNPTYTEQLDAIYRSIIPAGTYVAPNIATAEAAKVIENAQRDLNIAFVNELSIIFDRLGLVTKEVLKASQTKWNFLPFQPGLVGGHCIGIDPYYLAFRAREIGYTPEVLLSGRKINDQMVFFVQQKLQKLLAENKNESDQTKILILGLTFKPNVSDVRNSQVIRLVKLLESDGMQVQVMDPMVQAKDTSDTYNIHMLSKPDSDYDAIIWAVNHDAFAYTVADLQQLSKPPAIILDLNAAVSEDIPEDVVYWAL